MGHLRKRNDELIETEPVVKQFVTEGYVKATTWRLTTLGHTGPGVLRVLELVSLVVVKIGHGSLSGLR